jgi:hypothetical protein
VEHQPWRKPVILVGTAVIGVVCLIIGFALGQNKVVTDRISNALLSKDLEQSQARVVELESDLIDARLNVDVQHTASNALREEMASELEKSTLLTEEVTFYKGLMSPSSLSKGLQVEELEITPSTGEREYSYRLLLTQVALRRSYIAGEVRVDIIGESEAVLSLTELSVPKAYPLKFRFRYFQDLAGRINLPAGFVPVRVLVTAQQNGKETIQIFFPWPSQE